MWAGTALSEDQSEQLIRCKSLKLTGARLDVKSEYDFFRSIVPKMKQLVEIDLSRTGFSDHNAPLLHDLTHPHRGALTINLAGNNLGARCFDILVEALGKHQSLQSLDLSRNFTFIRSDDQARRLGRALAACKTLTSLSISFPAQSPLGAQGMAADEAHAQATLRRELVEFYHHHNPSKIAHVDVFLRRFLHTESGIVQTLRQKYPMADTDGIARAAAAVMLCRDATQEQRQANETVNPQRNNLFPFLQTFAAAEPPKGSRGRPKKRARLGVLQLSSTQVSVRELLALDRLGVFERLCVLGLRGCECGSPGAKMLASLLANGSFPTLMELDLTGNGIDDEGGCALVQALIEPNAASLTSLNLMSNHLGCVTAHCPQ